MRRAKWKQKPASRRQNVPPTACTAIRSLYVYACMYVCTYMLRIYICMYIHRWPYSICANIRIWTNDAWTCQNMHKNAKIGRGGVVKWGYNSRKETQWDIDGAKETGNGEKRARGQRKWLPFAFCHNSYGKTVLFAIVTRPWNKLIAYRTEQQKREKKPKIP